MKHHHCLPKRGRHPTVCKTLRRRLAWLEARPEVKRVVLDIAVACRHQRTPGTIEVVAVVAGGVKLKAYDARGVRLIFVKTPVPQTLLQVLTSED